jgi:hypothetical protein
MKTLLTVFHSLTGGIRQTVEAAARGTANEPEVEAIVLPVAKIGAREVLQADGYIFATPENLAAMAGVMKDFFDRAYYAVLDRVAVAPMRCASAPAATAPRRCGKSSVSLPGGGSNEPRRRSSFAPERRPVKRSCDPDDRPRGPGPL